MTYTEASIFYSNVCLTLFRNTYIDICMYVYKLRVPQSSHHAKHSYVRLSIPCTHVYVLCCNTLHKVPIPTMHTYVYSACNIYSFASYGSYCFHPSEHTDLFMHDSCTKKSIPPVYDVIIVYMLRPDSQPLQTSL